VDLKLPKKSTRDWRVPIQMIRLPENKNLSFSAHAKGWNWTWTETASASSISRVWRWIWEGVAYQVEGFMSEESRRGRKNLPTHTISSEQWLDTVRCWD
jgi:hypothetical protein